MVPLAGLVDVAFLGHLSDVKHLAGVALATVLFNYLYWTFGFLRMSTTGLVAQASGRGDEEEALLIGLRHWLLALAVGVAIVILQWPLKEGGFTLLNASPEVKEAGRHFYDALIWGAPATLLNFVLVGWFLGRAQSRQVLALTATSSFVLVGLDYLFIIQWGWGSVGAGAATALSQYTALVVGMIFVATDLPRITRLLPRLLDASWQAVFRLNLDITIRTLAHITVFSIFINLGASLGTTVLAANAVMMQVVILGAYFIDGLAFATESLVGFGKGQGNPDVLVQVLRVSGLGSLVLGLAFALIFISSPGPLFGLITNQPPVLALLPDLVVWLLPVLGFGSLAFMLDGYFLGLTEGAVLRNATIFASLVGFAPLALFAWQQHSNPLLWLAMSGYMVARMLALGIRVPATLQ
ncbi:MAG: MATE family efflux transporter [Gemmatimonadaceae bacterium]|nr:MATE family efflux transporter [Gloeobacterales cyanobacterium ES-bin-141]